MPNSFPNFSTVTSSITRHTSALLTTHTTTYQVTPPPFVTIKAQVTQNAITMMTKTTVPLRRTTTFGKVIQKTVPHADRPNSPKTSKKTRARHVM